MNTLIHKTAIAGFALTLAIAGSLSAAGKPQNGALPERPEGRPVKKIKDADNPGGRARWMDERYNESYARSGGKSSSGPQHGGVWSQSYQRFMMAAAKRERLRYAAKMPVSGTSKAVLDPSAPPTARAPADSLSRDLRWTNLGPTKANFLRNGGTVLNVTDTGRINAIETDPANPNTIYLAFSGGGLWKTTDGGASWQAKTETLGSLSVGSFALDPNNPQTMYLGLGDPFDGTGLGIVKMTQGGDAWEEPVFLGSSTSIRKILVAPSNSNIVLVATNQGLYRSTNAGKTYVPVSVNTGVTDIPGAWSLAYGGGNTIVMSLEATPTASLTDPGRRNGQIWRSTDNGATWTLSSGVTIPQGVNRITLASAPSNRSIMYALASKPRPSGDPDRDLGTIFKSVDGGQNWTSMATDALGAYKSYTNPNADASSIEQLLNGQGWYNHAVVVDRTNPDIAYFGGALHIARTTDGGQTYSIMTDWLADFGLPYVHADAHSGHIASNGTLYFGTDGGIFASSNGGTTFTDTLNEGIAAHLVFTVCSSPAVSDRILMGLQDNGSRLRETNTGIFNQILGGDGFGCNVNRSNASRMLMSFQYLGIHKSVNGGANVFASCAGIAECNNSDTAPFFTAIVPWAGDSVGDVVYTHSDSKVYRSTNYATSWAALGTAGLPSDLVIRGLGIAKTSGTTPNNDSVVGIVASAGRIYLTTDGGATWARQAGVLPNNGQSLSSIAFDPVDRNILYVSSVAASPDRTHLWRSTDFGASWAAIDGTGFPVGIPVNQIVVDPTVRTTLYAATHLGAYRSLDSGSNWERLGSFLPLVEVTDISVLADGNRVRA
ncbi:WD40/YVTN/BNR-like repeat-containing protein, partial [Lysobacter hankyongensis]|uniref:WD40/YVTN/BNR-like repeat-containing protein n=1 Tax=Lysobacter hankyongensis TaxID=1176535 RepID=UPI003CD07C91